MAIIMAQNLAIFNYHSKLNSTGSSSTLIIVNQARKSELNAHKKPGNSGSSKNRANAKSSGAVKKEEVWQCVGGCGACCKLAKGPSFATPEEIFTDSADIELYRSLIGPDGWCIHFEKSTRTCSIYSDRPYFCRAEPDIFESLYGIDKKKFDKEACGCCRDTIKAIYGRDSDELNKFNRAVRSSELKNEA